MLEKNYVIFNNINTLDFALIEDLPMVDKAEDDIEFIEIDGRHGFLTFDKKSKKPIDYNLRLIVDGLDKIDLIKSIFNGSGKLVLSNNKERYYKAVVTNTMTFNRQVKEKYEIEISFKLQPFAYELNEGTIVLNSNRIINNITNATSQPIIIVNGLGDGLLTINDNVIQLKGITDHIILNFELEEAYDQSGRSKNMNVLGEFEEFKIGSNTISWNGGITSLIITPNWRWQ